LEAPLGFRGVVMAAAPHEDRTGRAAQTHETRDLQVSKQGASSLRESTIGVRFRRRGLTVPGILLGLPCLLVLLAPVLLVGGLTDLVFRRRGSTVRVSLYAVWLFAVESVGIVRAGLLWLRYAPSGQLGGEGLAAGPQPTPVLVGDQPGSRRAHSPGDEALPRGPVEPGSWRAAHRPGPTWAPCRIPAGGDNSHRIGTQATFRHRTRTPLGSMPRHRRPPHSQLLRGPGLI